MLHSRLLMVLTLVFTLPVWSDNFILEVEEKPDIGTLFPVIGQIILGEADGEQFVSVANQIGESFKAGENPTFTRVTSSFVEWSYNRGIGALPDSCRAGFEGSGALCYESCPAGFDTVAGVCW